MVQRFFLQGLLVVIKFVHHTFMKKEDDSLCACTFFKSKYCNLQFRTFFLHIFLQEEMTLTSFIGVGKRSTGQSFKSSFKSSELTLMNN